MFQVSTKFEIINKSTDNKELYKERREEKSQIELFGNVLTDSEVKFLKNVCFT